MKSKAHMKKCLELGVSVSMDETEIQEHGKSTIPVFCPKMLNFFHLNCHLQFYSWRHPTRVKVRGGSHRQTSVLRCRGVRRHGRGGGWDRWGGWWGRRLWRWLHSKAALTKYKSSSLWSYFSVCNSHRSCPRLLPHISPWHRPWPSHLQQADGSRPSTCGHCWPEK